MNTGNKAGRHNSNGDEIMKKVTTGVLLAGAAILGGTVGTQSASAADVTLKFANWLPPFHHWTGTELGFVDPIPVQLENNWNPSSKRQKQPTAKTVKGM